MLRADRPAYPDLVGVTEELYDKTHALNARGPFRLGSLFGARMFEGDGGSIINVSTAGSQRPNTFDLPYAMAKAGLNALTLGLAGSLWAVRFVETLLFQQEPRDPMMFAGAAAVLVAAGVAAAWMPAWRAARLDPATVLREG